MIKTTLLCLLSAFCSAAPPPPQPIIVLPNNYNSVIIRQLTGVLVGANMPPQLQVIILENGNAYDGFVVTWTYVSAVDGETHTATHSVVDGGQYGTVDILYVDAATGSVTVTPYALARGAVMSSGN